MTKKRDRELTWDNDQEPTYDVGYKRPPQHSRFQPGQSGNPRGRPRKQDETLDDIFHRVLNKTVKVPDSQGTKSMSVAELLIRKQLQQAVAGDKKAFQFFVSHIPLVGKRSEGLPPTMFILTDHDDVKHEARIKELGQRLAKYEDVEDYNERDFLKVIESDPKINE